MFTLLHTNDFHNHLSEKQAERLREARLSLGAQGLLLDAGDAVASGNVTFRPGGEPILDTMSQIGYDAMTVGNREFHVLRIGFHTKVARATFPVLCANVLRARGAEDTLLSAQDGACALRSDDGAAPGSDPPVRRYLVRELESGWRVVIFGLTVPMVTARMVARRVSAYLFESPIQTAAQLVPYLKETYRPNLVVALTHIGIQQDRTLAETVPGIDLIVGGHTHVVLEAGERVGETLIVQAGCHGHYLGRVEIEPDALSGRPLTLRARLEPL